MSSVPQDIAVGFCDVIASDKAKGHHEFEFKRCLLSYWFYMVVQTATRILHKKRNS